MTLEDTLKNSEFTEQLFALFPEEADLLTMQDDVIECATWWSIVLQEHKVSPSEDKEARGDLKRLCFSLERALDQFDGMSKKARWFMDRRARVLMGGSGPISEGRAKVEEIATSLKSLRDLALVGVKSIPSTRRGRPRSQADAVVEGLAEIWEHYSGKPATLATDAPTGKKSSRFKDFYVLIIPMIFEDAGLQSPSIDSAIKAALYPPKKDDSC